MNAGSVNRSGTILIIVAGISALLASLAMTFLVRMRADADESRTFLMQTQARVMLGGALNYIGETSRIGWDDPLTDENEEAFGWVDVRDGTVGPRDRTGRALYAAEIDPRLGKGTKWPAIGSRMICTSMALMERPPTSISPNTARNPIIHEPAMEWRHLVGFHNLHPIGVAGDFATFVAGEKQARKGTDNPCWFRIYRKKPAVFIITCGAGASGGYRSWQEVVDQGAEQEFGTAEMWEALRSQEAIYWYETEWNPAVATTSPGYMYRGDRSVEPVHISKPFGIMNELDPTKPPNPANPSYRQANHADHPNKRNQMGTFLYVQRLMEMPTDW